MTDTKEYKVYMFIFFCQTQESPFVIEEGNNTNKYIGFCQELLDKLATDLDFTYQIYQVPQGQSYGTLNLNGTWNGMVGQLIDKVSYVLL